VITVVIVSEVIMVVRAANVVVTLLVLGKEALMLPLYDVVVALPVTTSEVGKPLLGAELQPVGGVVPEVVDVQPPYGTGGPELLVVVWLPVLRSLLVEAEMDGVWLALEARGDIKLEFVGGDEVPAVTMGGGRSDDKVPVGRKLDVVLLPTFTSESEVPLDGAEV
jgi:hypothetical protein